jgi:hypothetical protein
MSALIAVGGIGDLVAALFLHRTSFEVEAFERADEIRKLCVGINRLSHAVEVGEIPWNCWRGPAVATSPE